MSSPSSEQPKVMEHTYQSSDTSDHGLLTHSHQCQCNEKSTETLPKTESLHHQHCTSPTTTTTKHHIHHPINQSVHVHVHASPKIEGHSPKIVSCTCHLQDEVMVSDGTEDGGNKLESDDRIEMSPLPPALPPRPPPRPRIDGSLNSRHRSRISNPNHGGIRKYVFWCCVCGGLATILGALFLAVYFLLRSYTSTLGYFETIPTFVPATMLILTGLCVMSLARRKNRYSYLIKVCGLCCLVCALTCVLVTITTTVIHMNRLQTLRECVYTQKTRTCTCYSVPLESHTDDALRFIFDSTPDCEVIHGALYSCLRAMFGLSVSGILVCIFSSMLVYQLLSHERKKMYWEQLELRCRSFYQQHNTALPNERGSIRGQPIAPTTYCSCCDECRYPPLQLAPPPPRVYPWDSGERFWTPGRVGNLYSPNPEERPTTSDRGHRERTGWNWRRLPWTRPNQTDPPRDDSMTYQVAVGSADSQYGFGNDQRGSYSVLDSRPTIGGVYVWGPPPPYSDPNSPARRHFLHHHHAHEPHCPVTIEDDGRHSRRVIVRPNKENYENTAEIALGESTDSDRVVPPSHHTLPNRKVKKKSEGDCGSELRFLPRLQGVENAAFQKQEAPPSSKPETSESEVYFADVSSCCNISVRNDGHDSSLYDEAVEDVIDEREMSARSRLPFPLPKDSSQNSLCSGGGGQTPLTETTDDDAITPISDRDRFLAPDAQYEIIPDETSSNLTNTISGLNNFYKNYDATSTSSATARRNLGTNISALIQNLAGNPVAGLLYGQGDIGCAAERREGHVHACHSDGTMDSGWHSGSEKVEIQPHQDDNDRVHV